MGIYETYYTGCGRISTATVHSAQKTTSITVVMEVAAKLMKILLNPIFTAEGGTVLRVVIKPFFNVFIEESYYRSLTAASSCFIACSSTLRGQAALRRM